MWLKWLPWRYIISRVARRRGFIDPVVVLSRLHRFAQPSEVTEPIELLRAGVVFHARGLINTRAIQHNLDWVWPYWVERQFDPHDDAFVPRAFSITHVNLTHRNWTAIGQPDCPWIPIVDPRGLLTPLLDGWSIDAWIIPDEGEPLLPSRAMRSTQRMNLDDNVSIETVTTAGTMRLRTRCEMVWDNGPVCELRASAQAPGGGWLAISIRPANPEGVSFIHTMRAIEGGAAISVDDEAIARFDRSADRICMSEYGRGDVLQDLREAPPSDKVTCRVGLATAAALFRVDGAAEGEAVIRVPLRDVSKSNPFEPTPTLVHESARPSDWEQALEGTSRLETPNERMNFLYDAAVRSLILHSPGDVYPGPYTYKRFWFRDAAFILNALLLIGRFDRVERCIKGFPARQTARGYFRSQEGEWDSNGEALWIIERYRRFTGAPLDRHLIQAVVSGAKWIRSKRLDDRLNAAHAGLLPAGFSAEHLGPNDFYYWDDFWSIAGLRSAATIMREYGNDRDAEIAEREAKRLLAAIDRSLVRTESIRDRPGIPASPYRRLDSGAIGSLAASYPLQIWEARDERLLATLDFLIRNCMVSGGFFQDMIHSGINAYLTLHMAQALLRAGDPRFFDLAASVADLATSTGQWPEAIHPRTLGGCMGDGHHVWASAEWVIMMRSLFVREEDDSLIVGSGIPPEWLTGLATLRFGPTPTPYGSITVEIAPGEGQTEVRWEADWRSAPPSVEIRLPGHELRSAAGLDGGAIVTRSDIGADASADAGAAASETHR